jgi:predicted dehydrogenase
MRVDVLVVGAGGMAEDYYKVLSAQDASFDFVCRSDASAELFCEKTGFRPTTGGVEQYLGSVAPVCAIVATGVEHLFQTAKTLISKGVSRVLIEKPGALYMDQLEELSSLSKAKNAEVYIAYNRRFYSSVSKLRSLVEADGGIQSLSFDFTEWSDRIEPLVKGEGVKERWVFSNSTHVIDLAFYLAGKPVELSTFVSGGMSWHPSGSCFVGSGRTDKEVLFSYRSDWDSQGRWCVSVYTKQYSYLLSPLEGLSRIPRNSVISETIELDDEIDLEFKPGLHTQVVTFLNGANESLCRIDEHLELVPVYEQIAGY